ncbi:MAG: hypothetical protein ABFS24_14865, partial [Pseudomonadota bacterium]
LVAGDVLNGSFTLKTGLLASAYIIKYLRAGVDPKWSFLTHTPVGAPTVSLVYINRLGRRRIRMYHQF